MSAAILPHGTQHCTKAAADPCWMPNPASKLLTSTRKNGHKAVAPSGNLGAHHKIRLLLAHSCSIVLIREQLASAKTVSIHSMVWNFASKSGSGKELRPVVPRKPAYMAWVIIIRVPKILSSLGGLETHLLRAFDD